MLVSEAEWIIRSYFGKPHGEIVVYVNEFGTIARTHAPDGTEYTSGRCDNYNDAIYTLLNVIRNVAQK